MGDNITTPEEEAQALDVARRLIAAGVPVFSCPPDPDHPGRYILPKHWEKTVPSQVWVDQWKPGWAMAAVGGGAADFLDSDPRNGGDASVAQLHEEGTFPLAFGRQATPSGGDHWVIAPTGERKSTGFMPGLDLQSGAEDGQGRGFVYIAPTVRPSKDPETLGQLRAYRWVQEPDMELLAEQLEDGQDSTRGIVERIREKRSAPKERAAAPPVDAHLADDPFMTAQSAGYGGDRSFTLAEAQDFVRPALVRLQEAQVGMIEECANVAAATLAHFVPAFWTVDEAMGLLEAQAAHTAYDPQGPSDWTLEKFRAVLDGRRPPLDNWKAQHRAEPAAPPAAVVETAPGQEAMSTLEKLRARLVTADELAELPAPVPLVYDLLDLDTEAWLIGAPGSLKSFIALDLAGAVGAGREWQSHRVRQADVLYIAAEGAGGMVLRTRAYRKVHGAMPGVTFLPYPVQVKSNDGQWEALVQLSRELKPGLVVIDTQARVSVGLEENSATDMGVLVDAVGRLKRATGACVLVVHHTGRNGGDARGSSALDGAQDTELKVVRAEPRASLECKIIQDKQKDMAEGTRDGVPLKLDVVDLGTDPNTGRALSSLVVKVQDAMDRALEESDPLEAIRKRQPWLPEFSALDEWRRKLLDTLFTFATLDYGMTKSELDAQMKTHWPIFNPRNSGPRKAWADLQGLKDPQGEPVIAKVGGERWAVTHLLVRAALAEELGAGGGQVNVPGLTQAGTQTTEE
jgi:hypothetical protein